jgi:acetolactate synthase-1/2/3 large subunit
LNALLPLIKKKKHSEWINKFRDLMTKEKKKVIDNDIFPKNGKIKMGEIMNILTEKTEGKAIVCADVGQNQMAVARYYGFAEPYLHVSSGGLGTMGFGLPAAIGAAFGRPDKTVIAVSGDGGFQMTMQEMGTIMEHNLPVKAIIMNNNFLGMVRQWQDMFFNKRYASTGMVTPDFPKIAEAYGIKAGLVNERKELEKGIEEMLNHKGPYVLEIMVEKEANILPMMPPGASVSEMRLE